MFARSCLTMAILCASLSTYANIPIESRPLTTPAPQVTPTATAAAITDDQSSTLWKLYQQVQRLEEEVRLLRGRFESQEQQLSQTDKELKTRFTDLDQRFEQFKEQQVAPSGDSSPVATSEASTVTTSITPTPSTTPVTPTATTPAPVNSTTAATDDADKRAYVGAYEAYRVGGASKAVAPMRAFIQNFPSSVYVPNAHYWLGEFYLASTPPDFANAKRSFSVVMQQYPKSAKASAAIYRLATMAEVDDQLSDATRLMQLLTKQYPNTQEAGYAATFLKTHNVKSSSNTKPTDKSSKPANTSSTPRKPSTGTTSRTPAV